MEFSKAASKALIKSYKELIAKLNKQLSLYKGLAIDIREALNKSFNYALNLKLKELPIEYLNRNKVGIKIKVLKENRIRTILDVSKYGYQSLCDLNGIGSTNASKIINEARMIINEEAERLKIHFNDRNQYSDELLRLIYIKLELKEQLDIITSYNKLYREVLLANIKTLKKRLSPVIWIFSFKKGRNKIEGSFNKLNNHLKDKEYIEVNKAIALAIEIEATATGLAYQSYHDGPNRFLDYIKKINPRLIDSDDYKMVIEEHYELDSNELATLEKLLSGVISDE